MGWREHRYRREHGHRRARAALVAIGAGLALLALAGAGRSVAAASPEPDEATAAASSSRASVDPAVLEQWQRLIDALEQASAAREPAPVPPTPRKVTWRARRITSIDLGAPLLALAAGDVNGDARAELLAVTERDVVVLGPSGPRSLDELARAALPTELPASQPRDPVGTVVIADVDGDGIGDVSARSSRGARGAAFAMRDGKLVSLGAVEGFPLCASATATLASGRNYFDGVRGLEVPAELWSARCRDGLVDVDGRALRASVAVDTAGVAHARLERRCQRGVRCGGSAGWELAAQAEVHGVGVAVEIADIDGDGRPELIGSGAGIPGNADAVAVRTLGGDASDHGDAGKGDGVIFRKGFSGGVAGLAVGDVDGDGDLEVIAAVRLLGSPRVDLWLLD